MAHLQAVADQASSSVAERLLAAEADDALRLIEVVRDRYDAVLMNPPFGEPVPETKPYLRAAYPWLPTKDSNLLAAFVGRGLELCKPDGYLGAITSRAGMFLTTFEQWRREVVLGSRTCKPSPILGSASWSRRSSRRPPTRSAQVIHPPAMRRLSFVFSRTLIERRALERPIRAHRAGRSDHRSSSSPAGRSRRNSRAHRWHIG